MRTARQKDLRFIVSAEDATRTDLEFLLKLINLSKKKGAEKFRICDTVSKLDHNHLQTSRKLSSL